MDVTTAVNKFTQYTSMLKVQRDKITNLIYRIDRVSPYIKEDADKSDVNLMRSALTKGKSIIDKAYSKLSSITSFIEAAKESIGLGHPLILIATIAATVLGVVGGLIYTVGKITDSTNRKLDLIEKKVLPPSVLSQRPGFKIDLGPLRWLAYIGIGLIAFNIIRRKM